MLNNIFTGTQTPIGSLPRIPQFSQGTVHALDTPAPMQPATMPPMGQPGFYNPGNPLYQYHDPSTSTNALFQQGIDAAQPSTGVSSGYQSILDTIRKQQDYATNVGVNNAQSLAAKRGLTGSSIEQFGTNEAVGQASRAAQDASSGVLLQNEQAQNQLRQLQAQLYGSRAQSLAGLNSDELTSLRNADYSNHYLNLQASLGQQGLDLARQNISANQDIANHQARNSLIGSGASILAPYLFGGGGGGIPGFFGGGGGGGGGLLNIGGGHGFLGLGGSGGAPLAPGAAGPASPGMFGAGGGLFNTAGTSGFGAGNILPGVAGWQLGTNTFGDNRYTNIGGIAGGIGGSLFGPLGSAAGGFLGAGAGSLYGRLNDTGKALINPFANPGATVNAVKSGVSKVANTVSNVFPF